MSFLPIPPVPTTAPILTLAKIAGLPLLWTGEVMYVQLHFVSSGSTGSRRAVPRPCLGRPDCPLHGAGAEEPTWHMCVPAVCEKPAPGGRCEAVEGVVALPADCMRLFKNYEGKFRGRRCRLRRLTPTQTRVEPLDAEGLKVPDPVSVLETLCDRWGYPYECVTVDVDKHGRQILRFRATPKSEE